MELIIDPVNAITDYSRSKRDLQIFWLFSILVAGKRADVTATKLTEMLADRPADEKPFAYLRDLGEQRRLEWLQKHRAGQYGRINNAISDTLELNPCLRTSDIHEFVKIRGVKYKTAYFFMLHSRKDLDVIVLDTHVLAYLRDNGIVTPKTTPQSKKKYEELEPEVRRLFARDYPGMNMADADFALWREYSGNNRT